MALTRSFKELVQRQVASDPAYGEALLREGIDTMLTGDVDTGKAILRDYIKATVGFEELGEATGAPPKSLIRMFGPRGNPQAKNLFSVIGYLQKRAGLSLHVAGQAIASGLRSRRAPNEQIAVTVHYCFAEPVIGRAFVPVGADPLAGNDGLRILAHRPGPHRGFELVAKLGEFVGGEI